MGIVIESQGYYNLLLEKWSCLYQGQEIVLSFIDTVWLLTSQYLELSWKEGTEHACEGLSRLG